LPPLSRRRDIRIRKAQEHLIQTCPRLTTSRYKLARTLNNIFRESAQPQAITPRLTEAEESEHVENIGIGWDITLGWTSHTTDKHGRETLFCQGPKGRALEGKKRLTTWAHNILQRYESNLPWSEHRSYIMQAQTEASLDPHLLQGIASAINATHISDNIPHNPFIPATTTSNFDAPTGTHPVVFNSVDTEQDWAEMATHLTENRTWALLASPDNSEEVEKHLHFETKTQISPNSIHTWGHQFWAGAQSLFPATHEEVILVYTSTQVTTRQHQAIQDTIYMRSAAGGTLSDSPSIEMGLLIAETPPNLASLISTTGGGCSLLTGCAAVGSIYSLTV
jgi:hypothetical protein